MLEGGTLYYTRKRYLMPCMQKDVTLYYARGQSCIMLEDVDFVGVLESIDLARVLEGVRRVIY